MFNIFSSLFGGGNQNQSEAQQKAYIEPLHNHGHLTVEMIEKAANLAMQQGLHTGQNVQWSQDAINRYFKEEAIKSSKLGKVFYK